MKKLLIIPITFLAAGSFFLNSCGNTSSEKGMKAPLQNNADTTTQKEKKESDKKKEKEEKEKKEEKEEKGKTSFVKPASFILSNNAGTTNIENMQTAFKSETITSAKYAAYSIKAEKEGYHQIALLFKAVSTAENIHANNHKALLEQSGVAVPIIKPVFTIHNTRENLKDAIAGEKYEIKKSYPEFLKEAIQTDNQLAMTSLTYTYKTEKRHKLFYKAELAALENNAEKYLPTEFYVCGDCGNTYHTKAPANCSNPMTAGENFIKINSL